MHLSNLNQNYLIKTKIGLSYYFSLNKNKEIFYNLYSDSNRIVRTEILVPEIILDFSVAIDGKDQIHMICITKSGSLLYYIGSDDKWNNKTLSKLDVRSNIYRNLYLLVLSNYTHIFCTKTNLLNSLVSSIEHMYWNEKNLHKVTITSYIPGKYPSPFQLDFDGMGNLHMIYKVFYRSNHQLCYSKFNIFNRKWSNPEIISIISEDHTHPNLLIDKKDNLHLIWCSIEKNNFTLRYKNKFNVTNQKSKWSNPITLSSKNANNLAPILLQEGTLIKVYSKQNDNINEFLSEDYGTTWAPTSKSKIYKATNPLLFRYATNKEAERKGYKVQYVYGEINEGIHLFGTKLINNPNEENIQVKKHIPDDIVAENKHEFSISKNNKLNKEADIVPANHDEAIATTGPIKFEDSYQTDDINKPTDTDVIILFQDIESHMTKLVKQLEKLQELRELLRDKGNIQEEVLEEASQLSSKDSLLIKLNEMENNLSILKNEKDTIENNLSLLNEKCNNLEFKILDYQSKYSQLQEEVLKYSEENLGFITRIKNFFVN